MSEFILKIDDNFDAIPSQTWDLVAGAGLYKGHCWQKFKQASQKVDIFNPWTRALTVWQNGELLGLATAYRYPMSLPLPTHTLRQLCKRLLWPLNPISYLVPPTVRPQTSHPEKVMAKLIEGMRQLELEMGALGTRLTLLQETPQAALLKQLALSGFTVAPGMWQTEMELPWGQFSDFLDSLSAKRRKKLRQRKKELAAAGVEIVVDDHFDPKAIYQLFANVARKNRSTLVYNERTLDLARTILGPERFCLIRAEKDRRTVACSLVFFDQGVAYPAAVGLDYQVSTQLNLYRTLYYEEIEFCIGRGIRKILGGISQYGFKEGIGYRSLPTMTAVHSRLPWLQRFLLFTPQSLRR